MKPTLRSQLRPALTLLFAFTVLCGVIYPLLITAMGQTFFKSQAEGSFIQDKEGNVVGSELIGQSFTSPKYFWGRPSATTPFPYNAASSASSQLSPGNEKLQADIKERINALVKADPKHNTQIPSDLVTASASGLDPHISRAAAYYQIPRIAKARHESEEKIHDLVDQNTERREWFVFGEPRVHVLKLNLALDEMKGLGARD